MARIKVIVKPDCAESRIIGFDAEKGAYIIHLRESARDNKANIGLLKLISREWHKKSRITRGLKSKEKYLELQD